MKRFFKLYWPMAISFVLFFIYGILLATIKTTDVLFNSEFIAISLVLLTFLSVIGVWVELIYFMIKAANIKDLKGKVWWCIGIYCLNAFIIPYFNLKYVCKDTKYRLKTLIFTIISIVLFVSGLLITVFASNNLNSNPLVINYKDSFVFTFPGLYQETEVNEYDIYVKDKIRGINFGVFVYDVGDITSADYILKERDSWIKSTRDDVTTFYPYIKDYGDRIVKGNTYYASKDGVRNVYHIYTVTYKETNVMFNCIMVYLYDGNDYYDELIDIITKVEYIGNVKGL